MLDYSDIPSNTTALFEVGVGQVWARQKKVCHKKKFFFFVAENVCCRPCQESFLHSANILGNQESERPK